MTETPNLDLPLVQASQAQKHVTVNEALTRLDAATQLTMSSLSVQNPPVGTPDGQVYAVPFGATGDWAGAVGQLALATNGGWDFLTPKAGWRGYVLDQDGAFRFDGLEWLSETTGGAAPAGPTAFFDLAFDATILPGTTQLTATEIPAMTVLFGVTARVTSALTGSLASWQIGVPGSDDRYGSGYGTALNAWARGVTGQPVTYYSDTPLLLTSTGGSFDGGTVRFQLHGVTLAVPDPV